MSGGEMFSISTMLKVARREYVSHVSTRSFIVAVICTPLLLLAIMLLPGQGSRPAPVTLAIIDETGKLGVLFEEELERHHQRGGAVVLPAGELSISTSESVVTSAALRRALDAAARGLVSGVLVIGESTLDGGLTELTIPSGAVIQPAAADVVLASLSGALLEMRLRESRLPEAIVTELARQPRLRVVESSGDGVGGVALLLRTLGFVILLYLTTFGLSHALLTSVIEEKSSRVVELLLSAVTPTELMGGKILGIGAVGLTLVVVWAVAGGALGSFSGGLPPLPPRLLGFFILYFVLGFLLYASILAGIGAMVSSIKEAHHLVTPLTVLMMLPVLFWWRVTSSPGSALVVFFSWFPLTTPIAMMNRVAAPDPPSLYEIAGTCMGMLTAIVLSIAMAARLFRVGMLLSGSTPTLGMMFRWMRSR